MRNASTNNMCQFRAKRVDDSASSGGNAGLKAMSDAIALRSARLVAASFSGVVKYVDPGLTRPHNAAMDTLKMPAAYGSDPNGLICGFLFAQEVLQEFDRLRHGGCGGVAG